MGIEIKTVVCGLLSENAYLVSAGDRDDCVLIDPGDDLTKLRKALEGRRLAAILLTHGHFDHILAVQPLAEETGAPVYIHAEDVEMLNRPGINGYDEDWCVQPAPSRIEAQPLGETVSAAGLVFKVLHTPGHSKGSACLYLESEGILFSGDTLFCAGYGRLDLHGGNPAQMSDSLKRLFALPDGVRVYPGHGVPTTIGDEKVRYRL